ncbi:pyrimidine/purine nucleoside phosphorylase [Paenibacillus endoradicis]|uniref:pyrimidine/purine nucleoside phosphorylase n=1 Tax=Paenibacillus endoradicis TaxID=2972487 RepID=UPI0021599A5A|nr:pyrimidine/purine nucleoside phosphorylase [Paenibacillus endoradicis]MCR8657867.1 pyrimidine/purine nucleoside phosphorylase [Paenibacillus endoradicis]
MSQFDNVSVVKKANVYFEGKVTSRVIVFPDGTKKTLGIMLPGEYEFGTDTVEIMEILAGDLKVQLPGQSEWIHIQGEGEFKVGANEKFKLQVKEVADYICSYL